MNTTWKSSLFNNINNKGFMRSNNLFFGFPNYKATNANNVEATYLRDYLLAYLKKNNNNNEIKTFNFSFHIELIGLIKFLDLSYGY